MKAPTTELKKLCETYSISTRGNIHQILKRLLKQLFIYRKRMLKTAPKCFMDTNEEKICNKCLVQFECFSAINDLYRIKNHLRRFLIKQKMQQLKGKK